MKIPVVAIVSALIALVGLVVLSSSLYTIPETEQVLITQFGKLIGEPVTEAGLHFKTPFIQDINRLEKRALGWDGDPNEIQTKDKLFIRVDTYARWRINDPVLFYKSLKDERRARSRLDDILDGRTRDVIATYDLIEIIRTENREPVQDETLAEVVVNNLDQIKIGRDRIEREIFGKAAVQLSGLGIELMDIRLKRVNYNNKVQVKIFERMISEREQIAAKFRSEGEGKKAEIIGLKDRDLKEIESEAYKKIEEIKGRADARATEIYAKAYTQNPKAFEFYRFNKTMETYRKALGPDIQVILSTSGEFFKFLQGSQPEPPLP